MSRAGRSFRRIITVAVVATLGLTSLVAPPPAGADATSVMTGYKPFVTLLCKASGDEFVQDPEWYERAMSASYPGLGHYWSEMSYGKLDVTGPVYGWYDLGKPIEAYYGETSGFERDKFLRECLRAADPDVHFPSFYGINFVAQAADRASGGTHHRYTLDGQTRHYAAAITPDYQMQLTSILAHEMGHALGLNHSWGYRGVFAGGPSDYDSHWDVMSSADGACTVSEYGCLPLGLIGQSKVDLGWLSEEHVFTTTAGRQVTLDLHPVNAPTIPADSVALVKVPIRGSDTRFFTIETRRKSGYDQPAPGDAVVIHYFDELDEVRRVVDVDKNGDPNDEGAMWTVGETFKDEYSGVRVSIDAEGPDGAYTISVTTPARRTKYISRRLRFRLSGHLMLYWRVVADHGLTECEWGAPAAIQHKRNGRWRTIRTDRADSVGYGRTLIPFSDGDRKGLWRVVALPVKTGWDICKRVTAPGEWHRHRW